MYRLFTKKKKKKVRKKEREKERLVLNFWANSMAQVVECLP
jgi:hypothetical protein